MVEINTGIWKVETYIGDTWIWLKAQNDFIPEFKGEMCGRHMLYRYGKTILAQPMDLDLYSR